MPRMPTEYENEDGWSDWIRPLPNYRLACCDCGLVHKMDFQIVGRGKSAKVVFRARRNNRSTTMLRKRGHAMAPVQK